jgi:hypothetical protein
VTSIGTGDRVMGNIAGKVPTKLPIATLPGFVSVWGRPDSNRATLGLKDPNATPVHAASGVAPGAFRSRSRTGCGRFLPVRTETPHKSPHSPAAAQPAYGVAAPSLEPAP